jgi:hypothetical protein
MLYKFVSDNKTDRSEKTEILLEMAINQTKNKRKLSPTLDYTTRISLAKRTVTTVKGNNQKKTDQARPRNTIHGNKDEQTEHCSGHDTTGLKT